MTQPRVSSFMKTRSKGQRFWCGLLALGAVLLMICAGGYGENLLVNPGFEQVERDMPAGWQVFVMPQEGAEGCVDDVVRQDGKYSVMLRNPRLYVREPANNWSQNVVADVAGKELVVRGSIRTEDATEAALWLQCCRKEPWRVLDAVSSSTDRPVSGTRNWTLVEMRFTAPKDTDYVTVRCVLKGKGTAWFDNLVLECAPGADTVKDVPKVERSEDTGTESRTAAMPDEVVKRLIEAQEALAEANRALRDMNASLTRQIQALQAELAALRAEVSRPMPAPAELPENEPLLGTDESRGGVEGAPRHVPPLVPYGYSLEDLH